MVTTRPNDTQHPAEVSITILERRLEETNHGRASTLQYRVGTKGAYSTHITSYLTHAPGNTTCDSGVNQARLAQQISEVKLNVERWGRNEDMSVTPQ